MNARTTWTAEPGKAWTLRASSVSLRRWTLQAVLVSLLVLAALQVLHRHQAEAHELPLLLHWLRDAALAFPLALVAVVIADRTAAVLRGQQAQWSAALVGGAMFAVSSVPAGEVHSRLFVAEHAHETSGVLTHAAADGMSAWLLSVAALALVRGLWLLRWSPPPLRRLLAVSMTTALTAALTVPAALIVTAAPPRAPRRRPAPA